MKQKAGHTVNVKKALEPGYFGINALNRTD